jgi:hypothetical protein
MFSVLMHEYVARVSDQTRTGAPGMARVRTAWPTSNLTYCKSLVITLQATPLTQGRPSIMGIFPFFFLHPLANVRTIPDHELWPTEYW